MTQLQLFVITPTHGFPDSSASKESICNVGDLFWCLGWEDPLEKGKTTHSNIQAWRIPWTVSSMGSQRVGHDWMTVHLLPHLSCHRDSSGHSIQTTSPLMHQMILPSSVASYAFFLPPYFFPILHGQASGESWLMWFLYFIITQSIKTRLSFLCLFTPSRHYCGITCAVIAFFFLFSRLIDHLLWGSLA